MKKIFKNKIYQNILILLAIVILFYIIKKNIVINEGLCPGEPFWCIPDNFIETAKYMGKAVESAVLSVIDVIKMGEDMGAIFTSAFAPQPDNV